MEANLIKVYKAGDNLCRGAYRNFEVMWGVMNRGNTVLANADHSQFTQNLNFLFSLSD